MAIQFEVGRVNYTIYGDLVRSWQRQLHYLWQFSPLQQEFIAGWGGGDFESNFGRNCLIENTNPKCKKKCSVSWFCRILRVEMQILTQIVIDADCRNVCCCFCILFKINLGHFRSLSESPIYEFIFQEMYLSRSRGGYFSNDNHPPPPKKKH